MFKTILPLSASALEKAMDINNAARFDHDLPIDKLWSAENCPLELLPFLAWALSVDVWDASWLETIKRQVIASSAYVHRFKGTVGAIKAALTALDLGVEISEWFEHGGDPYTFTAEVELTTRGLTSNEIQNILDAIYHSKNARSHLESLQIYLTARVTLQIGAATILGQTISVQPYIPDVPDTLVILNSAVAVMSYQTIQVGAFQ